MSKKELIIQAATQVFADKGFFKATTGDIAKQGNIAVGTIYNYFSSKDEILDDIFFSEAEKRKAAVKELQNKNMTQVEKLEKLINIHFQALKANPALAQVVRAEKDVVRKRHPESFSPDGGMVSIIADILNPGNKTIDSEYNAVLIFGMMEILMERLLHQPNFDLDKAIYQLISVLKRGL